MFFGLFAGASLAIFLAGGAALGWRLFHGHAGGSRQTLAHAGCLAALVPVGVFSVWPYFGDKLVGAGDSYHYAIQVADAVTQARRGIAPLFAGQSEYAFNGNVHTLRTAPYYTHLAVLLDQLTGRRLAFVSLQNATVVVTAVLAAWAMYCAAWQASGGRRLAAMLLAAFCVFAPAIAGPLMLQDMFATFMATPWLVLCWHGLAGVLTRVDNRNPQLLAAGALGVAWYAHPPVAGWMAVAWGFVQFIRLVVAGGKAAGWRHLLLAGVLLAALAAYVFTSVGLLGARPAPPSTLPASSATWSEFRAAAATVFAPVVAAPDKATLRLDWSFFLLLALAAVLFGRAKNLGGLTVVLLLLGFLPLLLPIPGISSWLARLIPEPLVALSTWPAQRLCPLLATGVAVATAWSLRKLRPGAYAAACALLAIVAGWSTAENVALQRRPGFARLEPRIHRQLLAPENVRLTRYSYDLFERTPGYFTHGWTDPQHESRLFDERRQPADNATVALARAPAGDPMPIGRQVVADLEGGRDYLLAFSFTDPAAVGEISIHAPGIEHSYTLPQSGGVFAFGSAPENAKTLPLRLVQAGIQAVTIAASVPGVAVRVLPLGHDLPVRVTSQTPYTATVKAASAGFLETPRVFLQGYAATVNGRVGPVARSSNNLVEVPVPAGESEVILHYTGPRVLRFTWCLSLAAIASWPWWMLRRQSPAEPEQPDLRWNASDHLGTGLLRLWRHHRRALVLGLTGVLLLAGGAAGARRLWQEHRAYGSVRLELEIPRQALPRREALLVTGRTGAADSIYLVYEDASHVRIGVDHWGAGGPISEPIALDFSRPHAIEITMGSLFPESRWWPRPGPPGRNADGRALLRVTLDGRPVLEQLHPYHPARPDEVAIGHNAAGSSVAGEPFSGRIIAVTRQPSF